jgi:hypothetical protein
MIQITKIELETKMQPLGESLLRVRDYITLFELRAFVLLLPDG